MLIGRITPGGAMDKSASSYRRKAGLLIMVVLTGYAVLNLFWQGVLSYPDLPATDPVTIHEARIAQLLPLLPAVGEVGYVTTVENDRIFAAEKAFINVEFLAQYVLTQYTLAPRIVRNSPDLPLVVGNFIDGPPAPGFLEKNGLVPLKDLGDGLVLYRREREP
jgi:hypothetical protein